MSTLQELLVTLDAVNRDAERHAAELAAQAQRLSAAAARASMVTRGTSRGDIGGAAAALQAASKALSQAARHLHLVAISGKGFINRHSPGGATGATTPVRGPGVAPSLGTLALRLAAKPSTDLASLPVLDAAVTGALSAASSSLARWDVEDQRLCSKWFGNNHEATRDQLVGIVQRMQQHAGEVKLVPFEDGKGGPDTFAYVYPDDPRRHVFVGDLFWSTDASPPDSQAGVILHELSHFRDVAGTADHVYGTDGAEHLSAVNPSLALENADNIEYYFEELINR